MLKLSFSLLKFTYSVFAKPMFCYSLKRFLRNKSLVIFGLSTLLPITLVSSALARTYDFFLYNFTEEELVEVNLSPTVSDVWGENRLPMPVSSGGETAISFSDSASGDEGCSYDFLGTLASGKEIEKYGIDLCEVNEAGFFDVFDEQALYEDDNTKSIFITNISPSSRLEDLLFVPVDGENQEPFFLIGDNSGEAGDLPGIPPGETSKFFLSLPNGCDYKVYALFDQSDIEQFSIEQLSTLDLCTVDEIVASDGNVSGVTFEQRDAAAINNTSSILEVLEISPSFRPELWINVLEGSSLKGGESAAGTILHLNSGNRERDCSYNIYAVFSVPSQDSTRIPHTSEVEQYGIDLCENEGRMVFTQGVVLQ